MTFPLSWADQELVPADLGLLAPHFTRTISEFLPCRKVDFVALWPDTKGSDAGSPEKEMPERWAAGVRMVRQQGMPVLDADGESVFLPIWNAKDLVGVAVLEGEGRSLHAMSRNWLLERSRFVSREFQLIKKWSIDPATGLLNGRHLQEELQLLLDNYKGAPDGSGHGAGEPEEDGKVDGERDSLHFALVLVEIYPRAKNAEKAFSYISKAGAYLDSLIGHYSPLHSLGGGVFALIWNGADVDQALKMGDAVLRWLKQEEFVQAHIGITPVPADFIKNKMLPGGEVGTGQQFESKGKPPPALLLDQAWGALRMARRRGPYALCSFAAAEESDAHPLRPASPEVLSVLKRLWRGKKRFALALLSQDQGKGCLSKRICSLIGQGAPVVTVSPREAYVFLAGMGVQEARSWVGDFKERVRSASEAVFSSGPVTFSVGIAVYPRMRFTKSDIPGNARKALLHTTYFGPDTMTVFDGVSLNISGDVYYNEGDLAKALREYRLGLAMDPANVNLLNSLAVAYAQMNRYRKAIPLFEKVLEIDCADFMALFNLGFAYLNLNREKSAIDCFERAAAVNDQHFDLLMQLGRLYCRAGRYAEAVRVLNKAKKTSAEITPEGKEKPSKRPPKGGRRDVDLGAVQSSLGEAYNGLGQSRQAMASLERAIRYNPSNANALSMLGELYAVENQGDEIALSLCERAVDLDDSHWRHWFRLGHVQFAAGDISNAMASVKKSLRLNRKAVPAMYLLARLYERQKQVRQAVKRYEKVLVLEPGHQAAGESLAAIRKKKK